MCSGKVRDFYDTHAAGCAPDDYWGQVKRTVGGKPVGEDQIRLIEAAILDALRLEADDVLLDLCCGNGALTDRVFARCRGGLGVDFSATLVEVACRDFARPPERVYVQADIAGHVLGTADTGRFTKALCYGSLQYLAHERARIVLRALAERFAGVGRVFVGNLPDRERVREFYGERYVAGVEQDAESPLGIWRTEGEFAALAAETGWRCEFRRMPAEFYAAHYRYDAILSRGES